MTIAAPDYTVAYGNNYTETKDLDIAEIAKLVRKDIRAAIKKGDLPKIKVSVKISRYSGGQSLDVTVKEAPYEVMRGPTEEELSFGEDWKRLTKETLKVEAILEAIVKAYNFDGNDLQTDYFHVRFYSHVSHRC